MGRTVLRVAYLFGAICPAKGKGAALALPFADTDAMQLHLEEIRRNVAAARMARSKMSTSTPHAKPGTSSPPDPTS